MIPRGEIQTQDQIISALRAQFFNAMQQFAPHAWQELCMMKDAYKSFFGDSIWNTWAAYSYILEPANGIHPHWRDDPYLLVNPNEMELRLRQYELFKDLQEWKEKHLIQDTWVMDFALDWLRHISLYADRDNDKPSSVVGLKAFLMPIDPEPPKLPTYDAAWISRKQYLKEAADALERYCDDIEREALDSQMQLTKASHPRALEWLIRFHFGRETYESIAGHKSNSSIGEQIRNIAKQLNFALRPSRGRPKKRE